jgi:hypothetical protein
MFLADLYCPVSAALHQIDLRCAWREVPWRHRYCRIPLLSLVLVVLQIFGYIGATGILTGFVLA